jgi:hypothetical protein
MNELEHKYEYLFSLKEFGNSQVQRGHQNANKMKRIKKKKRIQLQDRSGSSNFLPLSSSKLE